METFLTPVESATTLNLKPAVAKTEWTLAKDDLPKNLLYTSAFWKCQNGEEAELYIARDKGGFELECFSGVPASQIYIDNVDFSMFWEKAGLDKIKNPSFETQCFMIADHLCAFFCGNNISYKPSQN